MPEEVELVWDDSVAPETAIDFDTPNISLTQVLMSLAVAFGGLFGLVTFIAWTDPEGNNPVATRVHALPFDGLRFEMGLPPSPGAASHDNAEDGEDEDDHHGH